MFLDHVTIETSDVAKTIDFFETVFDLKQGERPVSIRAIPGGWLFDKTGQPLVHVIGRGGSRGFPAQDFFHHAGFHLDDFPSFQEKLSRMNIRHSAMSLPEINQKRLFFNTPGNALCEAVFSLSS